jgi:thioredoxin reductase (NADPH)
MYDLIIVGYGVSGITASIYALRAKLNILVIEKEVPGGVLNKIKKIENYPGFDEISGPELAFNMFMQASKYNVNLKIENVIKINKVNEKFIVKTDKNEYISKSVILSTGRNQSKKIFKNEENYIGKGLSYCAICDANLYKDKDVIVIGNNIKEDTLYLSNIVNKVYLTDNIDLNKDNIVILNNKVKDIITEDNLISGVKLDNNEIIKVSAIFISNTQNAISNIYENKNIFNENGYVIVDNNMRTKEKHLYACGDIIDKKVYQIVTACSEGATAALSAKEDLG